MSAVDHRALFQALAGAYEARRLYDSGHRGARDARDRCREALERATASGAALSIALCDTGVLVGPTLIAASWATTARLVETLSSRGVQIIRLLPGITGEDVTWLLDHADDRGATRSPSGRVVLGAAEEGTGGPAEGAIAAAIVADRVGDEETTSVVDRVRQSWTSLLAAEPSVARETASLASRIAAAVLGSQSSLLRLVTLKSHDEYTFVHATNVGILASSLGEAAGMTGDALRQLTEGALLHDIGKWAVPKRVLGKAGALDADERALIEQHPVTGVRILASVSGIGDLVLVGTFEHHRRIDGGGYPRLARARPPALASQIVQIADVFDALRSDRPYRAGLPTDRCLEIMDAERDRAYDGTLFDLFKRRVVGRVAA